MQQERKDAGAEPHGDFDAVIVGAGLAGLYMLHRLRGLGLSARVYEAGGDVGGTWYWNRYPGARCDIESMDYSYSFSDELQQEWRWTERYAAPAGDPALHQSRRGPLRSAPGYPVRDARHRRALRRGDDALDRSATDGGERVAARFCIMATGCLSTAQVPKFAGLDTLRGAVVPHRPLAARGRRFHRPAGRRDRHGLLRHPVHPDHRPAGGAPLRLPADAELHHPGVERAAGSRTHERSVEGELCRAPAQEPRVARRFRRAGQRDARPGGDARGAASARTRRAGRAAASASPSAFADIGTNREANETAAEFVRAKIREIVHDPAVAEMLSPTGPPDRHQAPLARHRLLRDVQPRQRHAGRCPARTRSRRSPRRACGRETRRMRWTASSSPPASTR